MDAHLRDTFTQQWNQYFGGAELPLAVFYADDPGDLKVEPTPSRHKCVICELMRARRGLPLCFNAASLACPGSSRYLGFSNEIMPGFEYFLSSGIPGRLEGERYKQTPELVRELIGQMAPFEAPGRYFIAKRWDQLEEADEPAAVIFFATADVLSGLFTLANFDENGQGVVMAPFGAGCASIVQMPCQENETERPRCFLGMFDPSARKCVPANVLSFAVPIKKFLRMVENMEESFLITPTWEVVARRIRKGQGK